MELLSYNGGYIGYVPDQSLNLVTTGQTVENEDTGNIHIIGKAFAVDYDGGNTITFTTATYTSNGEGGYQAYNYSYHYSGDVIVLFSYADTNTTNQGQDYSPLIRDGASNYYGWTTITSNTASSDTNTYFAYFVVPKNVTVFLQMQGSATSGSSAVNFTLMGIRGLCKADGTLAGVSTTSAVFGSTGLPAAGSNSVSIPSGGNATDNWIVIQGWAVDDDVSPYSVGIGVKNYEFGHCRSFGSSSNGGTTGLAATIYRGAGGTYVGSGPVGFKTGTASDATDAWVVSMVAFKAGVEPTRTIKVPSVTGVYSLAAYTSKVGKWTYPLYPDGFPANDIVYYYKPHQQLSGEFCQSMYVTGTGTNSFNAGYYVGNSNTFNPTYYTYGKTYQQSITPILTLAYSGNGTTASVTTTRCSRIWIAEPCKIRFISLYYGRSNDSISWDVYEHSRQGGSLVATYGPVSGNGSTSFYSSYSSYYTISKPCYIVISLTSTLGGVGGSIPNNYALIYMEHIRV
jgi:hypothetical protein